MSLILLNSNLKGISINSAIIILTEKSPIAKVNQGIQFYKMK